MLYSLKLKLQSYIENVSNVNQRGCNKAKYVKLSFLQCPFRPDDWSWPLETILSLSVTGHRAKYSQDIDDEHLLDAFYFIRETSMFLPDIQKVNQKSNAFIAL